MRRASLPTETHALLPGSPAIDAGDDSAAPPTDQRGVTRPQGTASDIGAYEFVPADCGGQVATIVGTNGADVLVGTAGDDVIAGLDGADTIFGLEGNDMMCGGPGDDRLFGADGNDRLLGGDGADTLICGPGFDLGHGGPGTDVAAASCELQFAVP